MKTKYEYKLTKLYKLTIILQNFLCKHQPKGYILPFYKQQREKRERERVICSCRKHIVGPYASFKTIYVAQNYCN